MPLQENVLYCGEFADSSMVDHLKHALLPALILTAAQPDSAAFASLQRNELELRSPFTVRSVKPSAFSHEIAMNRLRLVHLNSSPQSQQRLDRFSHLMHVRSLLDVDNQLLTACVAPLLNHIITNQLTATWSASSSSAAAPASDHLQLETIRLIPSASAVHVDALTARALSIFRQEGHPLAGGRAKEGNSVYGLLNRTVSGVGAKVLRSWLQWPSADMAVLQARLDAVEFFTRPEQEDAIVTICSSLRQVKDVVCAHCLHRNAALQRQPLQAI